MTTADGRKTRREPDVELGIAEDLCIFQNSDDNWCLTAVAPMFKAGWEWD